LDRAPVTIRRAERRGIFLYLCKSFAQNRYAPLGDMH